MSGDWDREDNTVIEETRTAYSFTRDEGWYEQMRALREQREVARLERRATQGYFIPEFLNREDLISNFQSLVNDWTDAEGHPHTNTQGITHPWGANKLYIVCMDCGCIGYKLTDDISELQKCTSYNCRSRNIKIIRSGEIAIAVSGSDLGTNMQEVYNARRERLRAERAERAAERRNS